MITNSPLKRQSLKALGLFVLLIFSHLLHSQERDNTKIQVRDQNNDALIGATIRPLNQLNKGWVTNINGQVELKTQNPIQVEISFIGMISQTITISPGKSITVQLNPDLFGLEEVIVTGSYVPTKTTNSFYKVKILDQTLIKSRGAVNLGDLIQTQLNMKTIQDDVLGTRVVLQGISGPNVKMLMDGVPLVNGSGGEFDLSQINMNNVERVEIVEGPLSVQYGSNALAGTINIITRDNKKLYNVDLNTYYESVGQYNTDFNLSKRWHNMSLNIGGGINKFIGFSSTGERKENWIPRTQYLTNIKLKHNIKKIKITGSFNHMWENSVSHGNASSAFNSYTNTISEIASDYYFNTSRLNGAFIVSGNLSNNDYINFVNGVSSYKKIKKKYIQDVNEHMKWMSSEPSDHDTTSFTTWTFRGTYVKSHLGRNKKTSITGGYEASLNIADGGKISEDANGYLNDFGIFSAIEIPLGQKIKILPALRYTYNNKYDTKEINFFNTNLPILPSFNFMYKPNNNLDCRFSYGKGYRSPSVRELYYKFINANHYIIGNKNLSSEIGYNINTSTTYRLSKNKLSTALTTSVFFSEIKNKIELIQIVDRTTLPDDVPKNVPVARVYENIPNFKSFGSNLTAALVWKNGLDIRPGIGMLARSGSEADDTFYYSYEANLNTSYFWKSQSLRFNAFYKYNGKITEFAKEEDGSIGVLTLSDYNTLDISVSKSFYKNRLTITTGGKNLFNVTDITLEGDGSKGLVKQTGREDFYPISWGHSFFIKINYSIHK